MKWGHFTTALFAFGSTAILAPRDGVQPSPAGPNIMSVSSEEGGLSEQDRRPKARRVRMRVQVTEIERDRIKELACMTRLSASAYLRTLGLGWTPRSVIDHQAVLMLARVAADQGRLGGLLKLWLSARPGQGASVTEVRRLLREIEAAQAELRRLIVALARLL